MDIKLPIYIFFNIALGLFMILMRVNLFREPFERVGPENFDFLGPKWYSLCLFPFQGSKKSQFLGPTPSNGPRFSRIKIITSRIPRLINKTYTSIVRYRFRKTFPNYFWKFKETLAVQFFPLSFLRLFFFPLQLAFTAFFAKNNSLSTFNYSEL